MIKTPGVNGLVSIACYKCGEPHDNRTILCGNCGSRLVIADRYAILEEIKSGAMGCVYKAHDRSGNKVVALKHLTPPAASSDDFAYAVNRFREEARILSRLRHSGLPEVFDSFTVIDQSTNTEFWYLAMSFIEGRDLEKIIAGRKQEPFPLPEVIDYLMQILNVLNYLHSQSPPVIYRDLKPSNIMVNCGKLFLVDFGIAKIFIVGRGTAIGTPGYAAPEQYKGFADKRSDIFSLGVLIHYLLTGTNPEEKGRQPFSYGRITKSNRNIPADFEKIVMSMLEVVPEKRPASVAAIKSELNRVRKGTLESFRSLVKKGISKQTATISHPFLLCSAQPSGESSGDYVSIFEALKKKDVNAARAFVNEGTDVNACDEDGRILLHLGIMSGEKEIVRFLIERGADIFSTDRVGWTPMHCVARIGDREIAELLIYHGARVDDVDRYGTSPLDLAVHHKHSEIVLLLITRSIPEKLLKYKKIIKAIGEHKGVDRGLMMTDFLTMVEAVDDESGDTVLHYFINQTHEEMMKVRKAIDAEGGSTLFESFEIIYRALCNATDALFLNVLPSMNHSMRLRAMMFQPTDMLRVFRYSTELVKLLVTDRHNLDRVNKEGLTALHLAVRCDFDDMAALLIQSEANVNSRDNRGWTALHYSAYWNDEKLIELLLRYGADVNIADNSGKTPIYVAFKMGNTKLAERMKMARKKKARSRKACRVVSERAELKRGGDG